MTSAAELRDALLLLADLTSRLERQRTRSVHWGNDPTLTHALDRIGALLYSTQWTVPDALTAAVTSDGPAYPVLSVWSERRAELTTALTAAAHLETELSEALASAGDDGWRDLIEEPNTRTRGSSNRRSSYKANHSAG